MASLAGRSLVSSYKELLKLNNASLNSGISGSLQGVEDGFAGATALQISNAAVASTGTLASTGDFSVATNKLTVAAASGNTAVAGTLSATGDLAINTNKFTVAASSGNTVVAGTLNVSGTSTLASVNGTSGSFSSTLASTGDFSVATNKFNVTAASGNTAVAGTLSSAGDFSVATNKLTVAAATGNTAVAGTLSATGNLAINTNKFNVTASNGNTSVAGTLTVSDYADFSSTGAIRVPRGLDGERPAGQAGMLRFNTASQVFEGHNGVLWGSIGSGGGGGGSSQYVREKFTATSGQTSFTITGGYTPERIDVFQNGIKLVNGDDVTVTSGTSIVLTTGAVAGDVIDVVGLASGNFAGPATAKRQNFTATAGQTVFTVTGGYTPGQLDVFQNGTKLLNAVDVDVSNGSTFTLTTGANLNDTLEVVGFTAADTISGTLKFQDGTAAAPSITSFNDTNTGIFFPAADTIAFSEGGTEGMRIDSSGRVGIGTSSPTSRLSISGSPNNVLANITDGTANLSFYLNNSSTSGNQCNIGTTTNHSLQFVTNDTGRMLIDSSGNVLVNTTANDTGAKLEVKQAASGTGFGVQAQGNDNPKIQLRLASGSTGVGGEITSNGGLVLSTSNTERLRIDSSGRVGIGTTSPAYSLEVAVGTSGQQSIANFRTADSTAANNAGIQIFATPSSTAANRSAQLVFDADGANASGADYFIITKDGNSGPVTLNQTSNSPMAFCTNSAERLRITSGGYLKASNNGSYLGIGSPYHEIVSSDNSQNLVCYASSGSFAGNCLDVWVNRNTTNNTFYAISYYNQAATAYRFRVADSGNVTNTNNSYGAISDIKIKQDIVDASSQWSDIKSLRVRKYRFKSDPSMPLQLGLVAQEAETVSAGLIEEHPDFEEVEITNEDGTTTKERKATGTSTKAIKYSVLYMKAVKALQEAMERIEQLESKVAALEAA